MNSLELNKAISELFKDKIPQKSKVVNALSEILDMDKKSVYRRLNNEVFFTFSEVCKIASVLGISIDSFIKRDVFGITPNGFVIYLGDKNNVDDTVEIILQSGRWIANIASQPDSELSNITNIIPTVFCAFNKEMLQFYYYYINFMKMNQSFAQIKDDENFVRITDALYDLTREYLNFRKYYFVISHNPAVILLQKMRYYRNIRFLTEEEYKRLKCGVIDYIDLLEEVTQNGHFGEHRSACEIYVSEINFNSTFHYVCSEKASFSSIPMYMLGWHISYDNDCNELVRQWYGEMKETSFLITQSNFTQRLHFLEEQREAIKNF